MDWVATGFTLIAVYLLPDKPKWAVYFFIASSLTFLIWAVYEGIWSIAALQCVLIIMNFRTLYKWR